MVMNPIQKLLSICWPYRPDGKRAICPDFICTTNEKLQESNIKLEDIPHEADEGRDWEVIMEGDTPKESIEVHVFRRSVLEKQK